MSQLKYDIRTGVTRIRTRTKRLIVGITAMAFPAAMALQIGAASAASTVVVTPTNERGWTRSESVPNGQVNFVSDPSAPGGTGALQLLTDASISSKANYSHLTNTQLSEVTELSYYTKQVSASFPQGDASYQLSVCLNGVNATGCNPNNPLLPADLPLPPNAVAPGVSSFSTLVFEPYQGGQGPVIPGVWQSWDVDQGLFWSTKTVRCSNGVIVGTPGGPATYTLAQIQQACPNATVFRFAVNVGSNNPLYNIYTDLFNFNGTVYDFELHNTPHDKDQCKNGGYKDLTDENDQPFKNQGQCVSYTNHN